MLKRINQKPRIKTADPTRLSYPKLNQRQDTPTKSLRASLLEQEMKFWRNLDLTRLSVIFE